MAYLLLLGFLNDGRNIHKILGNFASVMLWDTAGPSLFWLVVLL